MMKQMMIAALSLALAGCATDPLTAPVAVASADARTAAGEPRARATAAQQGDDILVRIEAANLAAGTYAAHIHGTGRCDPPGFDSAGGHWNPTDRQHGSNNPQGMHKGDLPNLTIGADGRGSLEYRIGAATVRAGATPMLDADGAALVLHQRADDYSSDPSGNAGARIACGVFR